MLAAIALLAGVGAAATPSLTHRAVDDIKGLTGGDDDDAAPPCLPTVRACVDLDTKQAWLLDTGRVVRGPVPVTAGDDETPTPRGRFTVQWKAQQYMSREFHVAMPWAVFFADGGIAFHQGNFDHPSAGCVKLHEDDARAFFDFLHVGDPVQIV